MKKIKTASFEFLAEVIMQIQVFWKDVPCRLANNYDVSDRKTAFIFRIYHSKMFWPLKMAAIWVRW